ncbi:hypothetical protein QCA50_004961 [Cerrena zonata]|uniref:Uncharacterized protein n=1 Tax=Cerrena zonata TaxID=2478898 RepID=A0AAW0GID0_9APHY
MPPAPRNACRPTVIRASKFSSDRCWSDHFLFISISLRVRCRQPISFFISQPSF